MLLSSEQMSHVAVMSLQTGGELAQTKAPVINPNNLKIIAYEVDGHQLDTHPSFLLIDDVRELSSMGFIIDSSDEFVGLDDVIKLREVHDYNFELIGKREVDQKGRTLGHVTNYTIDPEGFFIKQLNTKRPFLKSFNDTELLIDRSQIVEITDALITVMHDGRELLPIAKSAKAYVNPFRSQTPQAEPISHHQSDH